MEVAKRKNKTIMEIKQTSVVPDEIKVGYLQVLLMPNAEILCNGETIGWYDPLHKYIYEEVVKEEKEETTV